MVQPSFTFLFHYLTAATHGIRIALKS